jgi:hypothetical protein
LIECGAIRIHRWNHPQIDALWDIHGDKLVSNQQAGIFVAMNNPDDDNGDTLWIA